jgi:hypothetical protein
MKFVKVESYVVEGGTDRASALWGVLPGAWWLIADVSEHCLFHLHRRVDMRFVKVESYVVEGGTDRPSALWGGCFPPCGV